MDALKIKKKKPKIDKGDLIFYCIFMAWPILQFLVYYVGVNINSILMSFEVKSLQGDEIITEYGFGKYSEVFQLFKDDNFTSKVVVSIKAFVITHLIGMPLGLLFAFYIFKKLPFWGGFRVILFLPSILSGVVVALMFRYFLECCVPLFMPSVGNLLAPSKHLEFPVLMFYNVWIGFGTSVLMYSNKMSSIGEEIIESAHLDGATGIKEFWYIVLPLTYATISVFVITGVAQIFVSQFGAYDMFGETDKASIIGIGQWFYVDVKNLFQNHPESEQIPYYSALGIVLTLITVPVAFGVRWALEHFGPSED